MIIECPCKKKKFNIDINLIPAEGRNLQCGSCDRVWFYKKEELISESPQVNEDIAIKEKEDSDKLNDDKSKDQLIKQAVEENEKAKSKLSTINENEKKSEEIKKTKSSKFFSYLIVFIISLESKYLSKKTQYHFLYPQQFYLYRLRCKLKINFLRN